MKGAELKSGPLLPWVTPNKNTAREKTRRLISEDIPKILGTTSALSTETARFKVTDSLPSVLSPGEIGLLTLTKSANELGPLESAGEKLSRVKAVDAAVRRSHELEETERLLRLSLEEVALGAKDVIGAEAERPPRNAAIRCARSKNGSALGNRDIDGRIREGSGRAAGESASQSAYWLELLVYPELSA